MDHENFDHSYICYEFIKCDLTCPKAFDLIFIENCDDLYRFAADMGGVG